ncbi:hypothetical protein [Streptomyces sp. NL15-2K]|uniref:effector-associated constant component EACC1 n=1 Tax=Streptomyces sp. NL15-2K TaxID=376149 RepID=UPI000FFAF9F5|nr:MULTISPECIES: hypothetical protein [Actinomycetes]WKX11038.1 hypothetical protein Q4V64_27415 [Kutzneria buriramensis]GCB46869.1 hypothetical protein SNL152K_4171 [Streptomyces sp. NL15-2K]
MRITIGSAEQDYTGMAVADLYGWLRGDMELRRKVRTLGLQSRGEAGAMGGTGASDVIELVLEHGIAALNLAVAYATWRTARPSAPAVTITFPGGALTVQDGNEETVRRIVEALRTAEEAGSRAASRTMGTAEGTGTAEGAVEGRP